MDNYNVKNYTEQGGEVTHIGGSLVFGDGAKVKNFPGAVNVPDSGTASAILKKLLVSLKDAGLMVGDEWNVGVKDKSTVTLANLPTAETLANTGHATVAIDGTEITVTLDCKVSELADADHGATWGVHKWLAFGVNTGLGTSVAGVTYTDTAGTVTLTADDDSEAATVGLTTGDFVLYIKAEKVLAQGAAFVLAGLGMQPTEYTIKIVEG